MFKGNFIPWRTIDSENKKKNMAFFVFFNMFVLMLCIGLTSIYFNRTISHRYKRLELFIQHIDAMKKTNQGHAVFQKRYHYLLEKLKLIELQKNDRSSL